MAGLNDEAPQGGAIRITASRPFRRAGFAFSIEPVVLAVSMLTFAQLRQLALEPALRVEMALDGQWVAFPINEIATAQELDELTRDLTIQQVRDRAERGELAAHDDVLDAMFGRYRLGEYRPVERVGAEHGPELGFDPLPAIRTAEAISAERTATPGVGAGAKHPAGEHDLVEQPTPDPEPTLPVAGGADTNATAAELVADKPIGPEPDRAAAIEAGRAPATSNPADPIAPARTEPVTPPAEAKPAVAKAPAKPKAAKPSAPAK